MDSIQLLGGSGYALRTEVISPPHKSQSERLPLVGFQRMIIQYIRTHPPWL
jgi:hypothetical protein